MQHNPANVTLSKDELELVTNAQILLTKNEIIKKVQHLFAHLSEDFVMKAKDKLPEDVAAFHPKISRGENYLGLPYLVLDYPRYFKKESTFAVRTFFWWGNFFSITVQLSGAFMHAFGETLQKAIEAGRFNDWFIGVSENEWEHHFNEDNYVRVTSKVILKDRPFIKLATKIPLMQWDESENFLRKKFEVIMQELFH